MLASPDHGQVFGCTSLGRCKSDAGIPDARIPDVGFPTHASSIVKYSLRYVSELRPV